MLVLRESATAIAPRLSCTGTEYLVWSELAVARSRMAALSVSIGGAVSSGFKVRETLDVMGKRPRLCPNDSRVDWRAAPSSAAAASQLESRSTGSAEFCQ